MSQTYPTSRGLIQPQPVATNSSMPAPTVELVILGSLLMLALGSMLYKQYQQIALRHRTRSLERLWQLDAYQRIV